MNKRIGLKNTFIKNVMILLSGTVVSQAIGFLILPVLTRFFSEELFGVFILYTSIIMLLKLIATLNFEDAILLPKSHKDAVHILVFNFMIVFLFCFLTFLFFYFFHQDILLFFNIQKLGKFIFAVPLGILFASCITILEHWSNRMNLFKNISVGVIGKSCFTSSAQVLTGFSNTFKNWGLIPGALLGQFVGFSIMLGLSIQSILKFSSNLSFNKMIRLAKQHKDILIYNTLLSFIETLSNEIPLYIITKFYGLSFSGIYGLSQKVTKTPIAIINSPVNQVFFNNASKLHHQNKNLLNLVKKTYKGLAVTACIIFLLVFIFSFGFEFIFGEQWKEVGLYVRICIPWLFLTFINSPISSIIVILNKQKSFLKYEVVLLIFRFLSVFMGYYLFNNIIVSIALLSAVGILYNTFCSLYYFYIAKQTV